MSEERVASTQKCSKCGKLYDVTNVYEVDTWNLGHYGCTEANCPRHFIRTIDGGCPYCKEKAKKKKKPVFTRGYKESRERLAKNPHFVRSCFNCDYYYQAVGDKNECCQNPNVLQFDMVVSENNIYCVHWNQSKRTKSESTLFKNRTGRSRLD